MDFTSLRKTNSIVFSGNALVLRVHQQVRQGEGKSRIPSGIEGWAGFPLLVLFYPPFLHYFPQQRYAGVSYRLMLRVST